MLPTREKAEELLVEAEKCNPGPWGNHSRVAAHCAEKIAQECGDLDSDKAYILGLLHDIGRKFGTRHMGHVSDGYSYMMSLGYDEVAQICLTHSFNNQTTEDYIGNFDTTAEELDMIQSALRAVSMNEYDRLIQLCDSLAGSEGVLDIEERMEDVRRRYGGYPQEKWDKNLEIKKHFEEKMGKDIYVAVEKDTFRPQSILKLLYGTGNPAKLAVMQKRLQKLDIELIGLKDLECEIPDVPENGNTPLENARQKATAYYHAFHIPVFSCDSGLYFDNVPDDIQPGVHVRTINGKYLTDSEMLLYYSNLAREYGNLTARYKNAICLVLDEEHIYEAMEPSMESERFLITEEPHRILKKGFPLDSLSIDRKSGKYYYDLPENELDQVAVEDGFIEFFQKVKGVI